MRKIIYTLFVLVGFLSSIFTPSQADASLKGDISKSGKLETSKSSEFFYFSDIINNSDSSDFVAAHYSHRSHSSHSSHRSHYSSRY